MDDSEGKFVVIFLALSGKYTMNLDGDISFSKENLDKL